MRMEGHGHGITRDATDRKEGTHALNAETGNQAARRCAFVFCLKSITPNGGAGQRLSAFLHSWSFDGVLLSLRVGCYSASKFSRDCDCG